MPRRVVLIWRALHDAAGEKVGQTLGQHRPIHPHPTSEGQVYCAAVLDGCFRRIVGWAMVGHLRSELIVTAMQMARWN